MLIITAKIVLIVKDPGAQGDMLLVVLIPH
jgi:hypothetical protein